MNFQFSILNSQFRVCLFVYLLICLLAFSPSLARAQATKSQCVVTKVGTPTGPTPVLPPECAIDTGGPVEPGGIIYPPTMVGPNTQGYYQLPYRKTSTDGYQSLNCAGRQWGSKALVGVLYTVAQQWKQRYPTGYLRIGDLNAAGHKTHNKGYAVDLDATTNGTDCVASYINGAMGRSCGGKYNRTATIELGRMFIDTTLIRQILYMDTTVNATLKTYAQSKSLGTQFFEVPLHDDHFHVDLNLDPPLPLPFWEPSSC